MPFVKTPGRAKTSPALGPDLAPEWHHRNHVLRSDYACRRALVEINVLPAKVLYLTLDELQNIARVQFPVIRQHEAEMYYDVNGQIAFTLPKGSPAALSKVKFTLAILERRKECVAMGWEDTLSPQEGTATRHISDGAASGDSVECEVSWSIPFDSPTRQDCSPPCRWIERHSRD